MISIYITAASLAEARRISRHLLEKRLIACANMFPVKSMYWWTGRITESAEYAMIAKAPDGSFRKVESEARRIHSYKVPCIVSWKEDSVSRAYDGWVKQETKKAKKR